MDNIIIVSSGTGGHVYPGMAIAYELKKFGYNPVFIVNDASNSTALNIVKNSGYNYIVLNFYAPPRKISPKMFLFPLKLIKNVFKAFKILSRTQPKAVIGMGAYLTVPVLIAAKIKKIPLMIHEQNSIPGLANKLLAKFADRIAVSFKSSRKYFCPFKTAYTSNPVRKDIFGISRKEAAAKLGLNPETFTVFIFGGSLGAVKLNDTVFKAAQKLCEQHKDKIQFIHITGTKNFEEINKKYDSLGCKKYIAAYMHDIGNAYACSDFAVCRAGAGTVKETEMYGLKALFVPYPYATENHQYFNAKSIEQKDRFYVIEEKNLTAETVAEIIEKHSQIEIDAERVVNPEVFPQEILLKEVFKLFEKNIF